MRTSMRQTGRSFHVGKCCHGRNRNNIQQENTSMEILEIKERKMKNGQRKEQ